MQYRFYTWRARKPGAQEWQELGWRMTEEDAKRWSDLHGRQIERVDVSASREMKTYGGAPV